MAGRGDRMPNVLIPADSTLVNLEDLESTGGGFWSGQHLKRRKWLDLSGLWEKMRRVLNRLCLCNF